ncbi:hypothetical protein LR48_Vigan04g151600 [Vigna angularis]|uniref:Uncharacterized protein n=1 Tax=Phaseolus angularis TaxID=3914 RepID=A0A0L9UEZ7_PHAAN|nr:hypothetical protein LR48_Vigan04g151600 [Vigna angularis]
MCKQNVDVQTNPTSSTSSTTTGNLPRISPSAAAASSPTATYLVDLEAKTSKTNGSTQSQKDQTHEPTDKKQKTPQQQSKNKPMKQTSPSWILDEDDDLVSEFTDLPNRFHQTLLPDLERISTTSKAFITTDLDPLIPADLDCRKDFSVVSHRRSVPPLPVF